LHLPFYRNSFFNSIKKARENRRRKIEEWHKKHQSSELKQTVKSSAVAKPVVEPQPVVESVPSPIATSSPEEKTFLEKASSFADNIVNPENHPEEPVTKQASSDDPTEDDDEESQEDLDNEDKDDAGDSTAEPPSPTNGSPLSPLLDQIKSDDGNTTTVTTFPPPNSIKPMDKEEMEKFIEEQRAQENTGLLCGCI
jgi:hypothetical protein